jgi:hypothetical protein
VLQNESHLRAIQGEEDERKFEDFEVPSLGEPGRTYKMKAAYLDCSEVLRVMNGEDPVLKSDDNVVYLMYQK